MSRFKRPRKSLFKALLPIVLLLVCGLAGAVGWLVYSVARPPRRPYLITPQTFTSMSQRAQRITEETWRNRDGTEARGWLLRGNEGAPAVIMLHSYGADRSRLLNLGVKLNETTNFTILWPDLRGHGMNPLVASTSLGALEAEDVLAAVDYLRALKTPQGSLLAGAELGFFGVELGGYAALLAAAQQNPEARARTLALDSVPIDADSLLRIVLPERAGVAHPALQWLARTGMRVYFLGQYLNASACSAAAQLAGADVLLLSGKDGGPLRDSTVALSRCFPTGTRVELNSELPLTGIDLASAPGVQGEAYDRQVIEFFDRTLGATSTRQAP